MRKLWVLLVVATTACGPRELRVTMNADNNSGQTGFAVLIDRGSAGMTVTVETSAPAYLSEPPDQHVHVHEGTCGEVGIIRAGLLDLKPLPEDPSRFGSTTEVVSVTFKMLETGDWLINAHDATDPGVYVSCGEIPKP